MPSWSQKNRGENFSSRFLNSELFWGGMNRYAATPMIVALSPGHSDITRFCPWSPIATEKHWLTYKFKWLKIARSKGSTRSSTSYVKTEAQLTSETCLKILDNGQGPKNTRLWKWVTKPSSNPYSVEYNSKLFL